MQDDIVRQPPANPQPPIQPVDTPAAEPTAAAQPAVQQEPVKQAPEQVVEPPREAVKVTPEKKGPSSPVGVIIFAIIVFLCLAGAAAYMGMTQPK